jgi:Holliday junction DNA helicase RuvA
MFATLRGTLREKAPGGAVVDVGGVGYQVQIPLSTFYELPQEGETITLRTTVQIRDDAIHIFGFATEGERALFRLLIAVAGVGPRTALAVLSGMSVEEVATAVTTRDIARLQRVPGIGRKTAERLALELHDKVQALAGPAADLAPVADGVRRDVVSALVNLGYPAAQAERAADQVLTEAGGVAAFESLLRGALRRLHR